MSPSLFTNRVNVPHEHVVSSMSIRYDPLPPPEEEEDFPGKSKGRETLTRRGRDSGGGIGEGEAVLVAAVLAVAVAFVLFIGYAKITWSLMYYNFQNVAIQSQNSSERAFSEVAPIG